MTVSRIVKIALDVWRVITILCAAQQQLSALQAVKQFGGKLDTLHAQIERLRNETAQPCDDDAQSTTSRSA